MEYNFISSEDNFNLNNFKSDMKLIEISEVLIWELHNNDRIIELFSAIKNRYFNIENFISIYNSSNDKFALIEDEIKKQFPEVESVNFKSYYKDISNYLERLYELVNHQKDALNVTDNLINKEIRTKILNGEKQVDYESEFTSIIKNIISIIEKNSYDNIESDDKQVDIVIETQKNQTLTEENNDDYNIENEGQVEGIIVEKQDENIDYDKQSAPYNIEGENENLVNNQNIDQDEETFFDEEKNNRVEENINENYDDYDNNGDENSKAEDLVSDIVKHLEEEPTLEEIAPIENVNENIQDNVELKNSEDKEKEEPSYDELVSIIDKYFIYDDSTELRQEEKEKIKNNAHQSRSALKYAMVLWELEKNGKLGLVESISQKIYGNTLTDLYKYDIGISAYSISQSWAIWDVAKQIYYLNHPAETKRDKYRLADPLIDEDKQIEIQDRHIGYEIYSKMTTGELDEFLAKFQNLIYRKRMVEFMIEKPNDKNTLASYKLAELGKNVRLGFAQIENK